MINTNISTSSLTQRAFQANSASVLAPPASEPIFKKNFQEALLHIRNAVEGAILHTDTRHYFAQQEDRGWTKLPEVCDATVKAQYDALQEFILSKDHLSIIWAGPENFCKNLIDEHLGKNREITYLNSPTMTLADIILAPHTLYSEMDSIFKATEALLDKKNPLPIEKHPLYHYFSLLKKEGVFIATFISGPDITSFTELLLKQDGLETEKANHIKHLNLKIFNNFETFFRCLDIFKIHFEKKTSQTIDIQLSYSLVGQPIKTYCAEYVKRFPELISMNVTEREKFIRLLSVFHVDGEIVDLNITLKMCVKSKIEEECSFWPVNQEHKDVQKGSNEISEGQLNRNQQIQNLNGSNESMRYIKNADGKAQFAACQTLLGRKHLHVVDLGGGRGETNGFQSALVKAGSEIHLLNFDPDQTFVAPYIKHHKSIGIEDISVKLKEIQSLSAEEVITHFKGEKVDLVYSSHCFYFILGDMFKASLDPLLPLNKYPMYKYIEMLRDDGILAVTMQTGAGSRLMRNALMGEHGLTVPSTPVADETVSLLKSFGNVAAFLRHFDLFAKRFKEETGKTIEVKMHYAVANVPLGAFTVAQDQETGGYIIHNPHGLDKDRSWLASQMLDFYGNWKEQQLLATLTWEKYQKMVPKKIKKWKLENLTAATLVQKQVTAKKAEETFLHILRAFAPAEVNMQHPNITLEISVKK